MDNTSEYYEKIRKVTQHSIEGWTKVTLRQVFSIAFDLPQVEDNIQFCGMDFLELEESDIIEDILEDQNNKDQLLKQILQIQQILRQYQKDYDKLAQDQDNNQNDSVMDNVDESIILKVIKPSTDLLKSNKQQIKQQELDNEFRKMYKSFNIENVINDQRTHNNMRDRLELPYDPFDFTLAFEESDLEQSIVSLVSSVIKESGEIVKDAELILKPLPQSQDNATYIIKQNEGASLGKLSSNTICLKQFGAISRKHCTIQFSNNQKNFMLKDLGSKSGTFIKIQNRALKAKEGRIIEMGYNEIEIQKIKLNSIEKKAEVYIKVLIGNKEMKGRESTLRLDENQPFYIGGHPDCQYWMRGDTDIDPKHVKMTLYKDQIAIEDLNTKNGTWLRLSPPGQESEEYLLDQFDHIKINPCAYQIQLNNVQLFRGTSGTKCKKCNQNPRDLIFLPCNHNIFCKACGDDVVYCPEINCQFRVAHRERIYYL